MNKLLFLLLITLSVNSVANEYYQLSSVQQSESAPLKAKEIASRWSLTQEEANRYQDIMRGPLGKWNANIDPIMALGIYAETEVERQRFAELYAIQEHSLTEMTQLFEREYRKAFKQLFPDAKIIDPVLLDPYYRQKAEDDLLSGKTPNSAFESGDKLLFFADLDCEYCRNQLWRLENILTNSTRQLVGVSVDVYVVNAKTEKDVRDWAAKNSINIQLVKNARMTLNIDNGLQKQLNSSSQQPSAFYLLRNGRTFAINASHIGL